MAEGPAGILCSTSGCSYIAASLSKHAHHQKLHHNDSNFKYVCGSDFCKEKFNSFKALDIHLTRLHRDIRSKPALPEIHPTLKCNCSNCNVVCFNTYELCCHFIEHLAKGETQCCPISSCQSPVIFKAVSTFRTHLSNYHKKWRDIPLPEQPEQVADYADDVTADPEPVEGNQWDESSHFYTKSSVPNQETRNVYVDMIAKFYLLLEAKLMLPTTTVQSIFEAYGDLLEHMHEMMESTLQQSLKEAKVEGTTATTIVKDVMAADILYAVHNKNIKNIVDLSTDYKRKKYYAENFNFRKPVELSVSTDHLENKTVIYVPIKQTLSLLLKDPSVQKQIDKSFGSSSSSQGDSDLLRDYRDGEVFRRSPFSGKKLDLFLFQDGVSFANPLGSAKNDYKLIGCYATLGNFENHYRAKIDAMQLVLMFPEEYLKDPDIGVSKCFNPLIQDLKELEASGIEYKGEMLPVVLQFIIGDNLGSHIVGGFVQSFNSSYYCRYCDSSKMEIEDLNFTIKPVRRLERYEEICNHLGDNPNLESYFGVRRKCPFDTLSNFKAGAPGFPPCVGHDLHEGVIDYDAAVMVSYFVKKNWLTRDTLNRLIKEFKYVGSDSPNKPASVREKRLGGHAVQNWTLLRLFPVIIQDYIQDKDDEVWKIFVLLKEITELICSPVISLNQCSVLKEMISDYLLKLKCLIERKVIVYKMRPKHHFMHHYPDLMWYFGPVIHLWTLRFESKHSEFKKICERSHNFINLPKMLATKQQLHLAYLSTGQLFEEGFTNSISYPLNLNIMQEMVRAATRLIRFSPHAREVVSTEFNSLKYKSDMWLVLGAATTCVLTVGNIVAMIADGEELHFVLSICTAVYLRKVGVFIIEPSDPISAQHVSWHELRYPRPLSIYEYKDQLCFSLQHAIVPNEDL